MNKRNPRLVPYNLLDEKTKKTNRDTVCAAVRTLIGYGYNIEPPDQESSEFVQLSLSRMVGRYCPTNLCLWLRRCRWGRTRQRPWR